MVHIRNNTYCTVPDESVLTTVKPVEPNNLLLRSIHALMTMVT